jgi:outer membrane protein
MGLWWSEVIRNSNIWIWELLLSLLMGLIVTGCMHHEELALRQDSPLPQDRLVTHRQDVSNKSAPLTESALTLNQAIEEALKASPELNQMEQRIAAAHEQVLQAEAAFYPRLVLSEEFNVTDNPVFALMNIINQRRLQTNVDFNHPGQQQNFASRIKGEWSLFEGGTSWYNQKASVNNWHSARAHLTAAQNHLVAAVTENYYRWLQALGFISVAGLAVESARTDERLAEARLKQEMALPVELKRLKAHTAETKSNLVTAQTSARRFQAAIERLLARPIRFEEIPKPEPVSISLFGKDEENPDQLVKQALEKRPEMAEVRFMIQAARNRVQSAQGGFLPKVGAGAQYGWDSEDFDKSSDSWMVGIQATWPLFEGGITQSSVREAQTRLREMEARGEQVALDIALEVHQAALAVQETAEKIRVAEERRELAHQALEEVRQLYRNQMVNVDSLLQAEVAWNQAEVSYTAALFEGKIAQALLRQSLGDFANWTEEAQHG